MNLKLWRTIRVFSRFWIHCRFTKFYQILLHLPSKFSLKAHITWPNLGAARVFSQHCLFGELVGYQKFFAAEVLDIQEYKKKNIYFIYKSNIWLIYRLFQYRNELQTNLIQTRSDFEFVASRVLGAQSRCAYVFQDFQWSDEVSIVLTSAEGVCFFLFSRFRDISPAKFLWKPESPSQGWLPQNFLRNFFRWGVINEKNVESFENFSKFVKINFTLMPILTPYEGIVP